MKEIPTQVTMKGLVVERHVNMMGPARTGIIRHAHGHFPPIEFYHTIEETEDVLVKKNASRKSKNRNGVVLNTRYTQKVYFKHPVTGAITCHIIDESNDEEFNEEFFQNDFLNEEHEDSGPETPVEVSSSSSRHPTQKQIADAEKAEKELLEMLEKEENEAARNQKSTSSNSTPNTSPNKKKNKKSSKLHGTKKGNLK